MWRYIVLWVLKVDQIQGNIPNGGQLFPRLRTAVMNKRSEMKSAELLSGCFVSVLLEFTPRCTYIPYQ